MGDGTNLDLHELLISSSAIQHTHLVLFLVSTPPLQSRAFILFQYYVADRHALLAIELQKPTLTLAHY